MLPNWNNAKNTSKKIICNDKGKKQEETSQNSSTAVPLTSEPAALQQPTNPAVTFALISLSVCPDFGKFFQPGVPKGPSHIPFAEPSASPGRG